MSKRKPKFVAFWKYDLYPYLLFGEIDSTAECRLWGGKLTYYIPSYQSYFAPVFVLPKKEGEILGNLLQELKRQKKQAQERLHTEYVEHLNRILRENGVDYEQK